MKKTLLAACMATALIPLSSHAQIPGFDDLKERLDSLGDPRIDMKGFSMSAEGNTIIKGPLHIRSDEMEVFANSAEYIQASEQLRFMGDVAIYRDGLIYRGEKATYNTNSGQLDATDMRSAVEPLFFKAGSLSTSTSEISVIETTDAVFTTEDSQDPDFHLESEKVSIYPEERVVFHKVKAFDTFHHTLSKFISIVK